MEQKERILQRMKSISDKLFALSDAIFQNPEYCFQEHKAVAAVAALLNDLGFSVETGVGGLDTAVRGVYDSGRPGPNLAFLGEYDAVPGMGHACGHNLMTPIAIGAAYALMPLVDECGGKLTVLGCPAEEGGGGKIHMLQAGAFHGIDAAMLIHPANETVVNDLSYSSTSLLVEFFGKKAHAVTWPEEGINALAPVLQLLQTLALLQPQIAGKGWVLGVVRDGGETPVMVPEHASAEILVRSFSMKDKWALVERVKTMAEAAAQMTGTRVEVHTLRDSYEDIRNNPVLEELLGEGLQAMGETIRPRRRELGIGTTDMGNVTHEVPGLQSYIQVVPLLRGHTPEFEKACGSPDGRHALWQAAGAEALAGAQLFLHPEKMEQVKQAFLAMKAKYE